jgi:hypothetical protein
MQRDTNFTRSAIAGGAAACAATVVFHPIDTIKTVLQRGGTIKTTSSVSSQIIQNLGGFRGLYIGVLPAAVSMAAACAVRMGAYEVIKSTLLPEDTSTRPIPLPPSSLVAMASGSSVIVSALIRSPLDMVKTQMQSGTSNSVRSALYTSFTADGVVGLYRGAHLGLLRDIPFFSINLVLYEKLKVVVLQSESRQELTFAEVIGIGGISQGVAGFTTNPVDVLKTRVQSGLANTFVEGIQSVLKDGGLLAFWKGSLMRTLWILPQGCVYYPAYEFVQTVLKK